MKKWNKLLAFILAGCMLCNPLSVYALMKNETVYTSLDRDGNIVVSSVTNHLLVDDELNIEDETELKDILNINGKETFTLNQNILKWNGLGKDIFYRGVTEKEQPIDVEIEYYLNDEKVKPKDVIGKEGNVKIILNFKNKLQNKVNVNGKEEVIYTPFVVTAGMVLNNENNKNIKVENGKSVDSGSRTMIVGLSTPGLYETLNIEELKKLNSITITYDTTKFSLGSMYLVATPKIVEESDLKIFEDLEKLSTSMNILKNSMDKIEIGSSELKLGSASLTSGANELSSGLKSALTSVNALKDGAIVLKNGITEFSTTIKGATSSLEGKDIDSSITGLKTLSSANKETASIMIKQIASQLQTLGVIQINDMDDFNEVYQAVTLFYNNNIQGVDVSNLSAALISVKTNYELVNLLLLNSNTMNDMVSSLGDIKTLKDSVPMIEGVLEQLTSGTDTLSNGLLQLEEGVKALSSGADSLAVGSKTLDDGINTLGDGISKINKEGISPLYYYSNTITNYTGKLEAMAKLSTEYKGFASNNSDSTLFVYMLKSVK